LSGEAKALLAAFIWALTIIIFTDQTRRLGTLSLNVVRGLFGVLFLLAVVPFTGVVGELRDMSGATATAMVGSGILVFTVGDSLYFFSLRSLGASVAVPIAESGFPLLTFLMALLWLDESFSPLFLVGAGLIVVGVFLLTRASPRPAASEADAIADAVPASPAQPIHWRSGLPCAVGAALVWAIGTVWIKAESGNLGPAAASLLRTIPAVLLLVPLARFSPRGLHLRDYRRTDIIGSASAGMLGMGLAGLLHVAAIQEAGAARTSILTATIPLFTLPLAVVFLREAVTLGVVLGTVACVVGISLVV